MIICAVGYQQEGAVVRPFSDFLKKRLTASSVKKMPQKPQRHSFVCTNTRSNVVANQFLRRKNLTALLYKNFLPPSRQKNIAT